MATLIPMTSRSGGALDRTLEGFRMPSKKPVKKPADVVESDKEDGVKFLDLQFVDRAGGLQHITVPSETVEADDFKKGIGKLDGSSIKGFKAIQDSDMVLYPDPTTYNLLPWYGPEHKTARLIVDVHDGGDHERFTRDSRFLAQKAAKFAADNGWDVSYWGPELEFFVFDGVRMLPTPAAVRNPWSGAGYEILSSEAPWDRNSTKPPIRFKEGYYPAPPVDTLVDFRNEACRVLMEDFGIGIQAHHHEVATAGQGEINMRYDELVPMADKVVTYKYVLKNVAARLGKLCTFMPKPIYGDNASGMHVHQSLWTKGKNTFYDTKDAYAELSQTGRDYIGGLPGHARALCAFTNPTTNSYRRPLPRVPDPRPELQHLPRLRGDAQRGDRRDQEEDRPGQSGRRGHLPPQREQAQGVRDPRAAGQPEGARGLPPDGLHVPQGG